MSANHIRRALVLVGTVVATVLLAAPSALAAPPVPAPVPDQVEPIEVTLDSLEMGTAPGTVMATGTITCSATVDAVVFGNVAQVQGLDIARDAFGVLAPCSSTPSTWTATSFGALRVFLPMPTYVEINAQYCVGEVCQTATITETVTLTAAAAAQS
ncbi:hypothetical protein ACI78Q_21890 [Geodermatophilus sp. SYSU D00705]